MLVAAVAAAALLLFWNRPLTAVTAVQAIWAAALAVTFAVDLRVRYILDIWTAPLALLAMLAAIALPHPAYLSLRSALTGGAIGRRYPDARDPRPGRRSTGAVPPGR